MDGCDKVILLSQYIGDFQPEAQVKGLLGCNFIALICNKNSATFCSVSLLLSMAQIYRIYINQSSLIITENLSDLPRNYQQIDGQGFDFLSFYDRIKNESLSTDYVLLTPNPDDLFKEVEKQAVLIKAAGGLVSNPEGKYLFIFRRGKWDLPKGKIDGGEDTRDAAVREVEEECGVRVDSVEGSPLSTYHIYEQGGDIVLKETFWFRMHVNTEAELIPQLEEDITEAKWLTVEEFESVKENTFPLILDVLELIEY